MKNMISVGLVSLLILSGVALAHQSGEQETGASSMESMMGDMTKGERRGKSGMGGMMGMMNMMDQMSKMMDQCSSMMESAKQEKQPTEEPKK